MSTYHPNIANRLQFGSLLRSTVAAAFLAAAGLSYLYLKHQLHVAGTRKKALESELRELSAQGRVLDSQIAALTSRTALQQRLKDGFIHMMEIPSASIVRIRLLPEAGGGLAAVDANSPKSGRAGSDDQLRPVSHEGRAAARTARQ